MEILLTLRSCSPVFRDAFNADMFLKSDGDKKSQAMKYPSGKLEMDGSALGIRLFCGLLEHGSLEKTGLYEGLEPATMFPPSAIMEAVHLGDLYNLPFFDNVVKGILPDLASRDSYGALAAYSVAHRMGNLKLAKDSLLMVSHKDWNPLSLPSKLVESLGLPAWRSLVCAYNELQFVKDSVGCSHVHTTHKAKSWVASPPSWISIAGILLLE